MNSSFIYLIIFRKLLLSITVFCFGKIFQKEMPINSFWITNLFFTLLFVGLLRSLIRDFLLIFQKNLKKNIKNDVIYGAGAAGAQLAASLNLEKIIILFVLDDNDNLMEEIYTVFQSNHLNIYKITKDILIKFF